MNSTGRGKSRSVLKRPVKNKLLVFFAILSSLLVIGTVWQNAMARFEDKMLICPGQLYDVNDHNMHIYGDGIGSPTVVFTVGSGTPCAYTDYYFIQKEISRFVRAVTYDRPGYGWSEQATIPRTVDEQVSDLHTLLGKAGEKPPYILVGHSLSSLEVIRYAQVYPEEVYGIVLIDGGSPTYYASYFEPAAILTNYIFGGLRQCGVIRALGSLGILTPMVNESQRYNLLPENLSQIDKIMFYRNLGNRTNRNAIKYINENAREAIDNGKLGSIPLIILSSKSDTRWNETQGELKDWSSTSRQETIAGARHYIHWDKPDIVIERILKLIKGLR